MKTKGTFILSEDYEETGNDDGIGTTSGCCGHRLSQEDVYLLKPGSFENNPEFKFKDWNECFAVSSLFMSAVSLVQRELAPQTS